MRQSGFSLLELSIVIAIISIVMGASVMVATPMIEKTRLSGNKETLETLKESLVLHFNIYGSLPCPVNRTLIQSATGFGQPAPDCVTDTSPAGVSRMEWPASSGNYIRIGAVPFAALNLSNSFYKDSWKNQILYAVDEDYLGSSVKDLGKNVQIESNANVVVVPDAAFVLVSHGPNGAGAYKESTGTLGAPCLSGALESRNCDNDAVFIDAVFNDGGNLAKFSDDQIAWAKLYKASSPAAPIVTFRINEIHASGSNKFVELRVPKGTVFTPYRYWFGVWEPGSFYHSYSPLDSSHFVSTDSSYDYYVFTSSSLLPDAPSCFIFFEDDGGQKPLDAIAYKTGTHDANTTGGTWASKTPCPAIGITETSSSNNSLQRDNAGVWSGPKTNTKGAANN